VESLSLFRAEESLDEIDAREVLGLGVVEQHPKVPDSVAMTSPVPEMRVQPSPIPVTIAEEADVSIQPPPFAQPEHQLKVAQPMSTSPVPSALGPLSSSPVTQILTASSSTVPVTDQPASVIVPMDDDEEDEEMPTIDMSSDSD
jgi:hypothetical protein